jgi:HEAT repeat protein
MQARLRADAEKADSMGRQALAYRQALIGELRNLKILDMTKPLDLEALYVQVRVREEEPLQYIRDEEIAKLAHGDPEQLLRLTQERLGERAVLALPPEEALRKFNRIAVLGDPGAGKTTMLRHLAFRSARGELVGGLVLPVYVELRRFVDSHFEDLLDFTSDEWNERYGFVDARPYLDQELSAGRSALLLDGLDEVLGGDTADAATAAYNRVSNEIDRLAIRFPKAPIAVTCRRAGWRGGLAAFQTLEVLDFSWDQIQIFLKNWFAAAPAKAEGLCRALAGNLRMQTMAANPLILSLVALVYERELELPERRAQLYNRCVEVLLKEWDAHREIRRFARFTTDRKRDLLEEVAWHFHRRGLRYFPKSELLDLIARFLPTIDLPSEEAEAILDEIAAHYGLLKAQAHDWYGFLHLTLQEYFAAVGANERGREAVGEVTSHRHDPWWEEVILLLAGRMADATPLLLGILGRGIGTPSPDMDKPLAADDDLFHGDLYLAARCLVGTPRIREQWLRERILAEVRALLRTSPYSSDFTQAARILVEIDGEVLTSELLELVTDEKLTLVRRNAIVAAFGRFGDSAVALRLLAFLSESTKLDENLKINIAVALGDLRYDPAFPQLVHMLENFSMRMGEIIKRMIVRDAYNLSYSAGRVAGALAALGNRAAAEPIMALIRNAMTWRGASSRYSDTTISACVDALNTANNEAVVPELFEILNKSKDEWIVSEIVKAIGSLAGTTAAPRLLAVLLENNLVNYLPELAETLRDLKEQTVGSASVEALKDQGRPWEIRWMLTVILEGYPESATVLAAMLEERNLDERVKVGIAATFAAWKDTTGLSYLREALKNALQPNSMWPFDANLRGHRFYYSDFVSRLLRNILGVDYAWTSSILMPYLNSLFSNQQALRNLTEVQETVVSALAESSPETISALIFPPAVELSYLKGNIYYELYQVLERNFPKSLIPAVIRFLEEQDSGSLNFFAEFILLRGIGRMADGLDSATSLFHMLNKFDKDVDSVYEALRAVCQRGRLRVFADGRVRQITTGI